MPNTQVRARQEKARMIERDLTKHDGDEYDRSEESSSARILPQLDFMGQNLSELLAMLKALESRLDPILLPQEMESDRMLSVPRQSSSVVSNIIDERNGDISNLRLIVTDLLERVQL